MKVKERILKKLGGQEKELEKVHYFVIPLMGIKIDWKLILIIHSSSLGISQIKYAVVLRNKEVIFVEENDYTFNIEEFSSQGKYVFMKD